MSYGKLVKPTVSAGAALSLIVVTGMLINSSRVQADDGDSEESRIRQGFAIAPVPLNLKGNNPALVGLGSYLWTVWTVSLRLFRNTRCARVSSAMNRLCYLLLSLALALPGGAQPLTRQNLANVLGFENNCQTPN